MSEETERRIRDALRSASLPAAPDSLRAALQEIPSASATAPRGTGLSRGLLVPVVLGAVLVIALAGIVGSGRQPSPSSPSASPSDTIPEPPPAVHVVSAAELKLAIDAQRAGGLAPQDVIADVALDTSRQTPPLTRECQPLGTCQVIGTLDGFDDPDGTVTIRQQEFEIPPPTTPADLEPPIALRLSGTAPIEYLGHVSLGGGAQPTTVSAAFLATATAPAGQVIPVDGWLEGTGGGWSCGPAPMPGPAVPEPFRCHVTPMLTAEQVKPVISSGNERSLSFPPGSIAVQEGAYEEYAPDPASDGTNDLPRHGLYLLRMVVDDASNCPGCRGWLVVGRLDATTTPRPTPSPSVGITVRSAPELAAVLAADRTTWIGRPVFVDGQVSPIFGTLCESSSTCAIGILAGTTEQVVATAYTRSLLLPDTDYPTNGVMAFIVRDQGLEYLGWMGYNSDSTFVFAIPDLQDPQHMARGPETVVVRGLEPTVGRRPAAWLADRRPTEPLGTNTAGGSMAPVKSRQDVRKLPPIDRWSWTKSFGARVVTGGQW